MACLILNVYFARVNQPNVFHENYASFHNANLNNQCGDTEHKAMYGTRCSPAVFNRAKMTSAWRIDGHLEWEGCSPVALKSALPCRGCKLTNPSSGMEKYYLFSL